MSRISEIVGLHEFVCHRPIISFVDLVKCKDEGVFVVVACYLGIDEGVDKWIDNQLSTFVPRWGMLTLFQLSACFCIVFTFTMMFCVMADCYLLLTFLIVF